MFLWCPSNANINRVSQEHTHLECGVFHKHDSTLWTETAMCTHNVHFQEAGQYPGVVFVHISSILFVVLYCNKGGRGGGLNGTRGSVRVRCINGEPRPIPLLDNGLRLHIDKLMYRQTVVDPLCKESRCMPAWVGRVPLHRLRLREED